MRLPFSKTIAAADKYTIALLALLLAAATFRLIVVISLPIWLRPTLVHDDGLFLQLATSLASGDWLGPYGPFTLLKGPGYPAFLAMSGLSGLPISATHALFQIAAMAVAAWVVYRLTASRLIAVLTFVALALDPVGFMPDMQRILADQIYWAQALLVFSLATIVLLYARPHRTAAAIAISVLTGAIFGWMWLTGPDSLWFLPGLALLTAGALLFHRHEKDGLRALVRNTVLAAAGFLLVIGAYMTANLIAYGAFTGRDSKERNFTAAVVALQSIEAGPAIPHVPVTKAARAEAAKVSRSFHRLNGELARGAMVSTWSKPGCRANNSTCGEYSSGWFLRALRTAADKKHYYTSPQTAAENFAKVAEEIGAACTDGRLKCRKGWLGGFEGMTVRPWAVVGGVLDSFRTGVALLEPPKANVVPTSMGFDGPEKLRRHWPYLNDAFISVAGKNAKAALRGWYYDPTSMQWPSFALYSKDGQPVPFSLVRRRSPDLQRHLKDARPVWNRFTIFYRCPDTCTLVALRYDRPELRVPLVRERRLWTEAGSAKMFVDDVTLDWRSTTVLNPLQKLAELARPGLAWIYKLLVPCLLLAGLVALVAACDGAIAARTLSPVLVVAAAAWVLVAARIVALAIPDAGAFPDTEFQNAAPAAYLAILASCLSFGAVVVQARQLASLATEPAPG